VDTRPIAQGISRRVSTRCRCPTSVPAERCSAHGGWPGRVHRKRSGKHPPPCSPSRPRNRANCLRTMTSCCCGSSPHFQSPISAACFLESTISVKSTVAKSRCLGGHTKATRSNRLSSTLPIPCEQDHGRSLLRPCIAPTCRGWPAHSDVQRRRTWPKSISIVPMLEAC
jgi:hypothetical protein